MSKELALLFDLDGTILDTDRLIFESFIHVFKKHRPEMKLDQDTLLSFLGPSLKDSFRRFFEEDQVQTMIDDYHEFNHKSHERFASVFPTVRETLTYFKKEGYKMAVVTTKTLEAANVGLDVFHLHDYFDAVVGMDHVKKTKPDPEGILKALTLLNKTKAVMIGDNPSDILAGKNAGVYTVAVKWSPKGYHEMEKLEPDALIDQMSDLIDVVKRLEE